MVNSEWCLRAAHVELLALRPGGARRPFTIYHSLFTPLLVVLARAGRKRAALFALAELPARAARGERTLVGAVAGAAVARQHALDFAVGAGDDVDADQLADPSRGRGPGVGRGL